MYIQEIIDLLEVIKTDNLRALANWLNKKFKEGNSIEVQTDLRLWANKIDQVLDFLKKQPTAGELIETRIFEAKMWVSAKDWNKLRDRLDTAEAINTDLLEACVEAQKVFAFIAEKYKSCPHFPNAERLVDAAITKYSQSKEG